MANGQTEEQRKRTFEESGLTQEQISNVESGTFDPTQAIVGDDLQETKAIELKEPEPTPIASAGSIQIPELPEIQPTETQKQLQGLLKEIQEGREQLIGESATRTQEEEERGISAQREQLVALQNQLRTLQAEELAIPLQIEKEFEGRGATLGGVAPIQRGRLRDNAIKALTVNATLQATLGNLSFALDEVDRAVAQKYDPIRAELEADIENYNLIANSPLASIEQQNRARKLAEKDRKRQKLIDREESNYQAILEASVQAAANGADPIAVRNIRKLLDDPTEDNLIEAHRLLATTEPTATPEQEPEGFEGLSPTALNVIDGVSNFDELTRTEKSRVKAELRSAGLFDDTPPDWFKQFMQEELQQTILPESLKEMWNEYRRNVIGTTETIEEDSKIEQLISEFPNKEGQIREALDNGFSVVEIRAFLSQ